MTFIKRFALILFCLFSLNLPAQEELKALQLKASPLIPIYNPVLIDDIDVNKNSFEIQSLLQTQVDFNLVRWSKELATADNEGVFSLPFAPYDREIPSRDKAIQLLSFNIDADRYCKAELSVVSTDRFEVYINGKKEKSKETKEDSLSKANTLNIDLTLEPSRYEVIIKRLACVKNFDESKMKAWIKPAKKDSLAAITITTDAKRRITIRDIMEGNRLVSGNLSSTGNYFLINTKNVLPEGKSSNLLELRETGSNKTVFRFPSDLSPHWLNKEDKLIYSRQGLNDKDLFLFDAVSLEETKIAENIRFDSYAMSPNNQFIVFTVKEEIPADKGDLKRVLTPGDRSGAFRNRYSLYLYTLKDKTKQRLTFGRTDLHLSDISPDSRKALLYASKETNDRPFTTSALYEMDLRTLALDTLLKDPFMANAFYSPDGQKILITGSPEAFNRIGENIKEGQISNCYDNQAFIYDRKTKEINPITKNFNPNIIGAQWASYDNNIYFRVEEKDYIRVYQYDTKSESYTLLDLPEEIIATFQVSESNPMALFRGESASNAYRLYRYDLRTKTAVLLADPFRKQLNELALSPMYDWTFRSEESGSSIEGRYYLPYNYEKGKKYPMIVYYYGGTSPVSRVFESTYPLHTYAALGYVVLTMQPSGTTGFGQEFAARHVNAWGKTTAQEIIDGVRKFCEEHAFVDDTKIGCIGASYGGFMTQYILTQTDLFAAAISHAGISAITSYWGEGYWGYSYSGAASAFSYPWNNPNLYIDQSPLYKADKITTPLLLLHGTADTNVPIGESIQMFNALKILGKTVEFVQVQGENHAIYDYKKRIEWNKTIHAWFAKWLKGQPEWWETLYPER
ncbi:MAG: prolyl oligopeptidase family serine peptidase [Dysgonamonadaceae bacterium]|jgi:dipeptidyl aminopeptidase/acylaminoacyl peptidase|nr:prolyl oligopeptidase family serine peptidase [Dysgonamonadaceae bacterium]